MAKYYGVIRRVKNKLWIPILTTEPIITGYLEQPFAKRLENLQTKVCITKILMEYWKYLLSLDRHWKSQNTNNVEMILMGIQDTWMEVVNVVVVKMMVKILLMTTPILSYQIHMQKSHSIRKYIPAHYWWVCYIFILKLSSKQKEKKIDKPDNCENWNIRTQSNYFKNRPKYPTLKMMYC